MDVTAELNPILSDESLIDVDGDATAVFFTPSAQRIATNIELITALAAGGFLAIGWLLSQTGGPPPG